MKILRVAEVLLLLAVVLDWVAFKSGWVPQPPELFAGLVSAWILVLLVDGALSVLRWVRGELRPVMGTARVLGLAGLVLIGGGGLANWLLSLQGFVVLTEGETVPLVGGGEIEEFAAGPLARLSEIHLALRLEELELEPGERGGFYPLARLRLLPMRGDSTQVTVAPGRAARYGTLRFHQGAFGFAPRIVITHDGESVFDRFIPFTTERRGPTGISFVGDFTIRRQALEIRGQVDLATLDAGMRGHATLVLAVTRQGRLLGRGRLRPGHFADIDDGYRIGFAGLRKWSEIDVSRRNYGTVVLVGAALALLGAVLGPLARWRGW